MKQRGYYWLCGLLGFLVMLLVFIPSLTVAQPSGLEINLVTGNESGEYYAIGKDLEKLALTKNIDIDVIPTQGALQNLRDVFTYESIPLGITQGDVLAFLNTFANDDEESRRQAESLRIVTPLYNESVHLITRQGINSVEELTGKIVSIGAKDSGTSLTAVTLLHQLDVIPKELLTLDPKRSIDALRKKEIDAFFYVVGTPSHVLKDQIFPEDNFQILPLALPSIPNDEFFSKLYLKSTLTANTYPWQNTPVETLAVKSYLFTLAEENCDRITPVAQLIKENLSELQSQGSPVWKEVNLQSISEILPERVSQCAVK